MEVTYSNHISNNINQLNLIRLNICGRRFEIQKSTAANYSDSIFGLLASDSKDDKEDILKKKKIFLNRSPNSPSTDEWYAERSITSVELILDYLCTGRLHCPESVCKEVLKNELAFWRLYDVPLADCCWDDEDEDVDIQKEMERRQKRKKSYSTASHATVSSPRGGTYFGKIKFALKNLVGKPSSTSKTAKIFRFLSVFFISVAVINLVISTVPALQTCNAHLTVSPDIVETLSSNATNQENSTVIENKTKRRRFSGLKYKENCEGNVIFEIIEAVCVAWFTAEVILRFTCSYNKRAFIKSPMNIIDLLAILPFYVDLIIWIADIDADSTGGHQVESLIAALRMFRVLRLFNVVRLARYSQSLKIMGASLWKSRNEFSVLIVFICFTVTIFSSVLFYCEKEVPDTQFESIPHTFYWGLITITTVGYGDMVPVTIAGKIFACFCCVAGIIIVAFPVSILVEHFHRLYRRRAKKSFPARIAILVPPNEIGVIQTKRLAQVGIARLGGEMARIGMVRLTALENTKL